MPDMAPFYFSLPQDDLSVIKIGRNEECDICIPLESVSEQHAYLQKIGDRWVMNDAGSTNGIRSIIPFGEHGYQLDVGVPFGLGDATLSLEEEPDDLIIPLGELERPHLSGSPDVKSLRYEEPETDFETLNKSKTAKSFILAVWWIIVLASVLYIGYMLI